MSKQKEEAKMADSAKPADFGAVVIGAGFSGLLGGAGAVSDPRCSGPPRGALHLMRRRKP